MKYNGQKLVEQKLSKAFQRPVEVKRVVLSFPLKLRIDTLKIEDALKVKVVDVDLSLFSLLSQDFVLSSVHLIEPVLVVRRTEDAKLIFGNVPGDSATVDNKEVPEGKKQPPRSFGKQSGLIIRFMEVIDGEIDFSDLSKDKEFHLKAKAVNLKARLLAFPFKSVNTRFKLAAVILSDQIPFSNSRVESEGWVNFKDKNTDASFKIIQPSEKLALEASLIAKNNDMRVKGHMSINNLTVPTKEEEAKEFPAGNFILNALKASGMDVGLDFDFQTKMDDFHVESVGISGTVATQASKDMVAEGIKKISEQFETLGKKIYGEGENGEGTASSQKQEEPTPKESVAQ